MQDQKTNRDLANVLFELFRILEDKKVDAKEGSQLCRACVVILQKVRGRVPKLWQRIAIDTVINILLEVSEYLNDLEDHAK
jgi:hypothetical protein|tara:strand:+ start:681 stop:923 length:243 start_codon:yes stop_codon:yes gene_type:complete